MGKIATTSLFKVLKTHQGISYQERSEEQNAFRTELCAINIIYDTEQLGCKTDECPHKYWHNINRCIS